MNRILLLFLGTGLMIIAPSCRQTEPDVCQSSPPEDDSRYERWLGSRREAQCKIPDNSPPSMK
jgi:hypothetical protein